MVMSNSFTAANLESNAMRLALNRNSHNALLKKEVFPKDNGVRLL